MRISDAPTAERASRRGSISLYARADEGTPTGALFIPFCYYEAAVNRLTNPVLDPFGKIPEFKFCAARVAPTSHTTFSRPLEGQPRCEARTQGSFSAR